MAETQSRPRLIRFGAFEADVQTGELRKDGVKLKFSGQPFQVLAILLERPGDVVTREELQKRLWPDTFVDVERNLNTAVNKIREVLGDSAESPRYVETLPRRGYRFIGTLEPPVQSQAPVEPIRTRKPRQGLWKIGGDVFAILVLVVGAVEAYRWHRLQSPQEQAPLTAVPFTALPGRETSPAFSPDGSRIAFAWNGDPANRGKGFDLYVKAIGSETLLRLTQSPSEWLSPTWSPNGTQIAFHRIDGADTGIYVVPALGGPERKLRSTRIPGTGSTLISWSPDGKWIAFSDSLPGEDQVMNYLLSTETLEGKRIPNDQKCRGQGQPAFSHSGDHLAFWCFRDESDLYSLELASGQSTKVLSLPGRKVGLTWSADDKKLIYSTGALNVNIFELGEVAVATGSVKLLASAGNAVLPAVSSKGGKLAFSSSSSSLKIWRRDLLHPDAPAIEVIASSRAQDNAQYSPDGRRIVFASERAGVPAVWLSNEDGSGLVQLSNPHDMSGSPQWSPDGKKIAFDTRPSDRWEIHVADLTEGNPRKLVTNLSDITRPGWSRDGKWIYFRSSQVGRAGLYRCPASGGDAIEVSQDVDELNSQESFDGRTVYFSSNSPNGVLKSMALSTHPATEAMVDGMPHISSYSLWTLSPRGIYFVPAEAPKSLRYFDFADKRIRVVFEVDNDMGSGLSVSPDGRWILYSQLGDVNSDIMLIDNLQ